MVILCHSQHLGSPCCKTAFCTVAAKTALHGLAHTRHRYLQQPCQEAVASYLIFEPSLSEKMPLGQIQITNDLDDGKGTGK